MRLENIIPSDIPELIEMGKAGHLESKYRDKFIFSEVQLADTFAEHCLPDKLGVKVVDDKMVGFLLATKNSLIFTDQPIVMETSYYIRPEYRGSRCFYLLLTEFNKWSEGLPQFSIPHFAEDNSKSYAALEKMGFVQVGRIYARGI